MLPPVLTYVQPAAEPTADDRSAARRGAGCLLEIVETVVLTLVIYLLIHNFVAQPFEVEQNSMVATIQPGDYVLIDKLTPRWNDYERGDIVVFQPPEGFEQGGVPFIKRVIGLSGRAAWRAVFRAVAFVTAALFRATTFLAAAFLVVCFTPAIALPPHRAGGSPTAFPSHESPEGDHRLTGHPPPRQAGPRRRRR